MIFCKRRLAFPIYLTQHSIYCISNLRYFPPEASEAEIPTFARQFTKQEIAPIFSHNYQYRPPFFQKNNINRDLFYLKALSIRWWAMRCDRWNAGTNRIHLFSFLLCHLKFYRTIFPHFSIRAVSLGKFVQSLSKLLTETFMIYFQIKSYSLFSSNYLIRRQ